MKNINEAIEYLSQTNDVSGAVDAVLGRRPLPIVEDASPVRPQTQIFVVQDQDALNRFTQLVRERLNIEATSSPYITQGGYAGYAVTITGEFSDGDVGSLVGAVKGQVHRLDNPAGGV